MVARTYVAFALEHPHHYRLVFLTPRPGRPAADGAAEATAPERLIEAHLLRAVTEASDGGLFRRDAPPPAWIARALWEGMHGLVSLEVVGRGRSGGKRGEAAAVPSPLDRLETMMTLLWRGVARGGMNPG
jgi:AcrR family transcriptional regulator